MSDERLAEIGRALVAACATVPPYADYHLVITPHNSMFTGVRNPNNYLTPNDATYRLAALLSALPVVEDAADHREEDNG